MPVYRYPDPDEDVTGLLIEEVSHGSGYWQASEELALHLALAAARAHLGAGRHRGLDVGCGEGRLLPWLARLAGELTAWDADRARAERAREAWTAQAPSEDSLRVFAGERPRLTPRSVDAVLCSHVLQHVAEATQSELVSWISEVASDTAALVLLFSHDRGGEHHVLESIRDGQRRVEQTDRKGFEAAVAVRGSGDRPVLPVRFLDTGAVAAEFAEHGWIESLRWEFHVTDIETPSIVDDVAANLVPSTAATGRDMLLVLTRGDAR